MCPCAYARNGEFSSTIQDWTTVQVQCIFHTERGAPNIDVLGTPRMASDLAADSGFGRRAPVRRRRPGPPLPCVSRTTSALSRCHPPETIWPGLTLPVQPTQFQYPAAISQECYCSIPPAHHPTQYPGATTLRSVRRGRRGTREKVSGVWRPTQRASHPRGGASVAECCGGLTGEKEGVEGKRGHPQRPFALEQANQPGFPPRRSARAMGNTNAPSKLASAKKTKRISP